ESAQATTLSRLQGMADAKARWLEDFFAERRGDLQVVRNLNDLKKIMPVLSRFIDDRQNPSFIAAREELQTPLLSIERAFGYKDIMLVSPSGRVLYAANPKHGMTRVGDQYRDRDDHTLASAKNGPYLSRMYVDEAPPGNYETAAAAPVSGAAGEFLGYVVFEINLNPIFKNIGETEGLGKTGEAVLGVREGDAVRFISPLRHDPDAALKLVIPFRAGPDIFPIQAALSRTNGEGPAKYYTGDDVLAAWRYLPSLGWGLVIKIDSAEAFAPVTELRDRVFAIGIATIVLGAVLAFALGQSFTRPLRQLEEGAQIVGKGDLDHKINNPNPDEIGRLARAFDQMTERLKAITASRDELNAEIVERESVAKELRRAGAYNRSLLEAGLDPLVTIGPDGKITDANRAAELIRGLTRDELIGSDFADYFTDPDKARAGYQKAFNEGSVKDYALEIKGKDGSLTPVLYNASVYRDEAGRVAGVFAAARDVTELRRVEKDVARANRALFTLSRCNEAMVRADDEARLLDQICRILVDTGGYRMAWIGYCRDDPEKTVRPMAQAGFEDAYLENIRITWADTEHGRGPTGTAIRTGAPAICQDFLTDPAFLPWRNGAIKRGYASSLALPLFEDGKVLGALMVYAAEPHAFNPSEVHLLTELADDLSYGVSFLRTRAAHRRAEDRVKAERQRFNHVLETLPFYVVLLTPDYHVPFANRVFRELFGESHGKRCFEFLFNRAEPCEICETFTVLKTNAPHHWQWTGPNGRDYEVHDFPFTDNDGSTMILEMGIDITERKRAEELIQLRLRLSQLAETLGLEEFLQQTLDEIGAMTGSPIGFYHFVEPDQRTLSLQAWSTRTLREFCRAEGRGRHYDIDQAGVWVDCLREGRPVIHNDYASLPHKRGLPPGHAEVIRELVAPIFRGGKAVAIFGVGNKPQDYTEQDVEIITRFEDIVWDIVERKRAEQAREKAEQELEDQRTMAIRADRLRSLGEMAAGIAHELNQPLQGVRGLAEHITIGFDRGWEVSMDKIREKAGLIMDQADRMTHIIEHVRTFARGADGLEEGPIQVNDVIRAGLGIIGSQLKSRGIGLELNLGEGLPPVMANPFSLEEVVINLINNARDALQETMARRTGAPSRITVRTYQDRAADQDLVKIEVADNGPGIPDEIQEKIFTPFFTTKPPNKGTGLGLSISRSIIEKYRGGIAIGRGPGGGAVVTVSLPAAGT
ncbi:MAG TPA: GAF domain-containing protein, partial [bacterium]|nr:GAF domain-containing protein [bacterium]